MKLKSFIAQRKKLLLICAAALLAVAVITIAWIYILRLKEPVIPAEKAIPADVAWYIKFNNVLELWSDFKNESDIGRELQNFDNLKSYFSGIAFFDSISGVDKDVAGLLKEQSLYVCCRYPKLQEPQYLILLNLPDAHRENDIRNILERYSENKIAFTEKNAGDEKYYNCAAGVKNFSYSTCKGIFIYSVSEDLVVASLKQLSSGDPLTRQSDFSKVQATAGEKVDANVYINLNFCKNVFNKKIVDQQNSGVIDFLSLFGNWASLDLTLKKDEILMNGYINSAENEFLGHVFSNQKARKIELTHYIPFNTAAMLYVGTEETGRYMNDYRDFLKSSNSSDPAISIMDFNRTCHCNVDEDILSWMGNEFALVITETRSKDIRPNTYGIFRIGNKDKALIKLDSISVSAEKSGKNEKQQDSVHVRKIRYPKLFPVLFGKMFDKLTENYYIILEDYLVVANSPQALQVFSAAYFSHKTLDKNENYAAFAANVSDNASICLYVNIRKSVEWVKSFLVQDLRKELDPFTARIRNFQAFAVQIAPDKNMFYTNIYIKYNPAYKDENPAIWEADLDTTAVGKPYLAIDLADSSRKVVVFDQLNQMYLIDHLGRIIWKIKLPERPVGEVFAVDRYKNRKTQLVFSTVHHLCMIDMSGKNVQGYPVSLKHIVTGGLSVADYSNTKEYRLLFTCDDQKFYNYAADGKPVTGWAMPMQNAAVRQPVVHIKMMAKDYLLLTDVNGKTYAYDRKGNIIYGKSATEFVKSKFSSYFLFPDGNHSRIITTDSKGRIIRLPANGSCEAITLRQFTAGHKFLYADFDGNGMGDYIFCDSSKLTVYNVNKKLIYDLELPASPDFVPARIVSRSRVPLFGIVSVSSGRVFLFSRNGLSPLNQYLDGSTPFSSGILDRNGYSSLIVAKGKTVYNYLLAGI